MIARELQLFGIEAAALQETRFEAQGNLQEEDYTFFWVGKTVGPKEAGVAFAVHNTIAKRLISLPTAVSPRLTSMRVPIEKGRYLTLVNVYAPTMKYSVEGKETFYQELTHIVLMVPREDKPQILGDFNARVGTDWKTYKGIIHKFGKKKKISNGELLLNFCAQLELSITNTFFYQPDKNYFTWKHPRSGHYHLLYYAITRKSDLVDVLCTKAMRGLECSTDRYLVRCQLRLKITLSRRKISCKCQT